GPRRTGGRDGVGRSLEPEIHGDLTDGGVDHPARNRQRVHARRILPIELEVGFIDRVLSAGGVADDGGSLDRKFLGDLQLRITHRRARRDDRELREPIEQVRPLRIEVLGWIEIEDLGCDPGGQAIGRRNRDRADPRSRFNQCRPESVHGAADRRDNTDPRDDDPVHRDGFASTSFFTMSAMSPTVENCISPLPSAALDARLPSSALNGMVMLNFSSRSNTISITSSDSAPSSSKRASGVSRSIGILSDFEMIALTSSIMSKSFLIVRNRGILALRSPAGQSIEERRIREPRSFAGPDKARTNRPSHL